MDSIPTGTLLLQFMEANFNCRCHNNKLSLLGEFATLACPLKVKWITLPTQLSYHVLGNRLEHSPFLFHGQEKELSSSSGN